MNLQEQIDRIQEMMGLNESNFLSAVQRRIRNVDELIFVSADEVNVQFSMCSIDEDDFIDATISKTLNTFQIIPNVFKQKKHMMNLMNIQEH